MNTITASVQQVEQIVVGNLRVRVEVLAWRAARQGHDDLAAHLFGAGEAARKAAGAARPLIDPGQYEQVCAMVRRRLGVAPYGAAWEEGYHRCRGSAPGRRGDDVEPAIVP